jgi:hypothetical protein
VKVWPERVGEMVFVREVREGEAIYRCECGRECRRVWSWTTKRRIRAVCRRCHYNERMDANSAWVRRAIEVSPEAVARREARKRAAAAAEYLGKLKIDV